MDDEDAFDMHFNKNVAYWIDVKCSQASQYGGILTNPRLQILAGSDELNLGEPVWQRSRADQHGDFGTRGGAGKNSRLKVSRTFQAKIHCAAGDDGTHTITLIRRDWPQERLAPDTTVTHEHLTSFGISWTKA